MSLGDVRAFLRRLFHRFGCVRVLEKLCFCVNMCNPLSLRVMEANQPASLSWENHQGIHINTSLPLSFPALSLSFFFLLGWRLKA